jgi:hypothetical protein
MTCPYEPNKTMRDLARTHLRAVYHRLMTCPYQPTNR